MDIRENIGQAINSVSRGGLNCVLMDLAEKHGVKIHFNKRCTHIDLKTAVAHFEDNDSKEIIEVAADRIFSTDGAFSAGRLQMQLSTDLFTYSQTYLEHGYKELTIPPTASGDFAMEANALHIWPRDSYMLIALPNLDGSFTVTLFLPLEGGNSFEKLKTEEGIIYAKRLLKQYNISDERLLNYLRQTYPSNKQINYKTLITELHENLDNETYEWVQTLKRYAVNLTKNKKEI